MRKTVLLLFVVLAMAGLTSAQSDPPPFRWVTRLPATCSPMARVQYLLVKYTNDSTGNPGVRGLYECKANGTYGLVADAASEGLTSLNSQTDGTQTFATGTTGTNFGITSSGGVHTFNLPTASSSNRGALSSSDWTAFNAKNAGIQFKNGETTLGTAGTVTSVVCGDNVTCSRDSNELTITATGGGSGGELTDGDKGDVTVASSGSSWTINNGTISDVKLASGSKVANITNAWTSASSAGPASLVFAEDTDNGSNTATVQANASMGSNITLTLPTSTGTLALTSGNVATATALAANPTDCSANQFATAIAANGNLTCSQVGITTGVSGMGTGVGTFLATPSSSNFASAVTDETGSGSLVFGTAPTLTSPVISTKIQLPRVTALPGSPNAGDTVIVTDDSATGACDSSGGSATTLCQYSGSAWVALGDGGSGGGGGPAEEIATAASLPETCSVGDIRVLNSGRGFVCADEDTWAELPMASTAGSSANQILGLNGSNNGFETKTFGNSTSVTVSHGAGTIEVQRAALTGDVTASANSNSTTIASAAITGKTSVSAAVEDQVLISDNSDSGNLKRATIQSIIDLAGSGGGDVSGDVGSTDNAIVIANGTGGSTVQGSGATIDDSGKIDAPAIAVSQLELKGGTEVLTLEFDETLTTDRTLEILTNDADRTISLGGDITTAGSLTTSGANALTLTTTGATNVTLPTTGTLITKATTYQSTLVIDDPVETDSVVAFFANEEIDPVNLVSVLVGSSDPEVTWRVCYNASRSGTCNVIDASYTTTSTTTAEVDDPSFFGTIPANNWVWIEVTGNSGIVDQIAITLVYVKS
ncbi:MAG: hypothetical protein KF855_03520 [Acidobacteria bacterium]|nr:hypothetical protein [Acidobacteriota bacterium]